MIFIGERINTGFKDIRQAVGDKDPADVVTGRVNEANPPAEVEVVQINTQQPRGLLVRVLPECAMEIRQVVVVDKLVVA